MRVQNPVVRGFIRIQVSAVQTANIILPAVHLNISRGSII